jgi:hypothetical protein
VFPAVDLNDASIDAHLRSGLLPQVPVVGPRSHPPPTEPRVVPRHAVAPVDSVQDSHLEAMVKATGQLDLDEEGNWDYHGHSSGVSFMSGLRRFGEVFQIPADPMPASKHRSMSQTPSSPNSTQSFAESPAALPTKEDLPSREEARLLCEDAILDASAMLRVVHLPTFLKQFDRMYDLPAEEYGDAEHSFLPLLFAVLSLGKLFSKGTTSVDSVSYETLIDEGYVRML